jgi:hypothetical protein
MTPTGIESATFWLVAQCLNQLRHCMPLLRDKFDSIQLEPCVMVVVEGRKVSKVMGLYYTHRSK